MDAKGPRLGESIIIACLAILTISVPPDKAQARAAHSPASSPAKLRTPEAREVFAEQMSGASSRDDLGSHLPPGINGSTIARLIVPANETSLVSMVGLKPWPARPGLSIVLVCTGGNGPSNSSVDGCAGGGSALPLNAYLALIEKGEAGRLKLVGRPVTIAGNIDWSNSLLPNSPEAVDDPAPAGKRTLMPSAYDRLDLTPYRIAPGETAFGVRASWSDGYAGGFGWHSAILLYAVVNGQLRQVLAVPTVALTFLAGDWHRDGTRDHEIEEGANVIIVSDHLSAGHADIVVRSRTTREERLFQWNATSMRYVPATTANPQNREPFDRER
ncbi:hypothetical protein [Sphingomonas sp. TREG-RG-20F-R18-01]|uniref:hypothetical protein n=1 Tax=Sphingomonas sp. TREG-RG-20F-R18-01 TaxID=2914982 RepID=UPI001F5AB11F|nr:hypothetical protein [Sphingomonas sp. TREG-RG-20F-R18-01]